MEMAKADYAGPEDDLARKAVSGDIEALYEIGMHYGRLMRYMLDKEIRIISGKTGFEPELFQAEDLLSDLSVILEEAIMNFRE